jgi:predicted metal-dependent peptidase
MSNEKDISHIKEMLSECEIILMGRPQFKLFGITSYGLTKTIVPTSDDENIGDTILSVTGDNEIKLLPYGNPNRENMMYSILHQLHHMIYGHFERKQERNEVIWNIACDHMVNKYLKELSSHVVQFSLPDNAIYFRDLDGKDDLSTEDIYEYIMGNSNIIDMSMMSLPQPSLEPGEPMDGEGDGDGDGEGEGVESESNDGMKSKRFNIKISKSKDIDGMRIIEVADKTTGETQMASHDMDEALNNNDSVTKTGESIRKTASSVWNSLDVARGHLPGNLVSRLDELFSVEIPWDIVLEDALLYPVQVRKRRTWMTPNIYTRRFARLPGKHDRSSDVGKLVCVIDTSASVSDKEMKRFLGIVADSIQYYNGLYMIQHDTDIQKIIDFERKPNLDKLIEECGAIYGRGGTSHRDVFDRIEEIYEDDATRISTVMCFTDYESDVQSIYNDYTWVKYHRIIWVLTTNHEVSLPGEHSVIRLRGIR